ncbi:MAG: hypothetical protein HC829_03390, partial [Bacteroidales bacterium]|nr:hypothetical protein [Bacteroidales bacterium]
MSAVRTFLIEPFDIMLYATEDGVASLQARFATWLRTLSDPARLLPAWSACPPRLHERVEALRD